MFKRRVNILSIAFLALAATPFAMSEDAAAAVDTGIPAAPDAAPVAVPSDTNPSDSVPASAGVTFACADADVTKETATLNATHESILQRVRAALESGVEDAEQFFETGLQNFESWIADKQAVEANDTEAGAPPPAA